MTDRAPIAAVLIPHGRCDPGCPFCPERQGHDARPHLPPLPGAAVVSDAVARVRARPGGPQAVEVALYGGDVWTLPRSARTALLDAAEREVRGQRAVGVRLCLAPRSVLSAPLLEFQRRGVSAVEVSVLSTHHEVMNALGSRAPPRLGIEALGRLHRARLRAIAVLMPGLPGSSHRSALASVDAVIRARPDGVRILPALALGGTLLGALHRRGLWTPMSLDEAITTCKAAVRRIRDAGIPVLRVGLQPDQDLWEAPPILAGPYDPSLRGRVEAALFRRQAAEALTSTWSFGTRDVTFVVHPREESWLRGPENSTIRLLRERFRLDQIRVLPLLRQPEGRVRVLPGLVDADAVRFGRGARKAS